MRAAPIDAGRQHGRLALGREVSLRWKNPRYGRNAVEGVVRHQHL
jgi:hypothetical protein